MSFTYLIGAFLDEAALLLRLARLKKVGLLVDVQNVDQVGRDLHAHMYSSRNVHVEGF